MEKILSIIMFSIIRINEEIWLKIEMFKKIY